MVEEDVEMEGFTALAGFDLDLLRALDLPR